MLDLQISLATMLLLCALAALAGARLQLRASRRTVLIVLGAVCAVMVAYLVWIWDRPLLSRVLPFSGAIILGNWLPVIGAFFAGICHQTRQIVRSRRWVLTSSMAGLCCYSLIRPILGEIPPCVPLTGGQILDFQTTDNTCSAACAVGLLRIHGIAATERELAELCLTRRGTHWLGVYRGLKLKTAGTEWDVIAEEVTAAELLNRTPLGILSLTFGANSNSGAVDSGFASSVGHSVVSLGYRSGHALGIFDPSPDFGIESWDHTVLKDVRNCILLRLVSRKGKPSPIFDLAAYQTPYWKTSQVAQTLR